MKPEHTSAIPPAPPTQNNFQPVPKNSNNLRVVPEYTSRWVRAEPLDTQDIICKCSGCYQGSWEFTAGYLLNTWWWGNGEVIKLAKIDLVLWPCIRGYSRKNKRITSKNGLTSPEREHGWILGCKQMASNKNQYSEVQEGRIDKCDLMDISKRLHGISIFEDTAAKDKWLAVATETKGQLPELVKLYIRLI